MILPGTMLDEIPEGHYISILYQDDTAGNYSTIEEAQEAIEMNVTGEMMGPHGDSTTAKEIWLCDAAHKQVTRLFINAKVTLYDPKSK